MIIGCCCASLQGTNLPGGTTFVPLIYSKNDATTANFNTAKKSGSGVVLAFNEPNEPAKGDTTVAVSP